MIVKVQRLDKDSFAPFGEIIGRPDSKPEISNPELDVWPGITDIALCSIVAQYLTMSCFKRLR